jgi:parallel beta-helix repeat protein
MSLAQKQGRDTKPVQDKIRNRGSCQLSPLLAAALWLGLYQPVLAQTISTLETSIVAQGQSLSQTNILYVSPSIGNDPGGNGSDRAPFKTITRALSVAEPNTTILLAPGTYSTQTGETFPLVLKRNVTIQGSPNSRGQNILIQGGGQFISPTSAGQNITILAADGSNLTGVTVTNPNYRGYGLWIESSSPTVANNTFTGNTHDGISVVGNSGPLIRGNYFFKNGANGITIFGNSQGEVRENIFENTGFGINISQHATPLLIGNRITFNKDGVVVQSAARPVLRQNYIERNQRDGIVAIAQSLPDLGTSAAPGSNVIRNNGRYDINNNATQEVIPAYGNQLARNRIVGRVDIAGTFRPSASIPPLANRGSGNGSNQVVNPQPVDNSQPVNPRPLPPTPLPPRSNRPLPSPREFPTPTPRNQGGFPIPTGAVEIPVPSPDTNSILLPPSRGPITPPVENRHPAESVLPVPRASIPVGSGGYVPSELGGRNAAPNENQSASALGLRYRVVVENGEEKELIRVQAIAPGAFTTFLKGKSVIQAGAFRDRQKADILLEMLTTNGLNARIEDMD